MATGDVVVRFEVAAAPPEAGDRNWRFEHEQMALASHATPEKAEEARRARIEAREAQRRAEKPVKAPWDAWREQKAPDIFEHEATHRG